MVAQKWLQAIKEQRKIVDDLEAFCLAVRSGEKFNFRTLRKVLRRFQWESTPYWLDRCRVQADVEYYLQESGRSREQFVVEEVYPLIAEFEERGNDRLIDDHELIEQLGEGGYGVVCRYRHNLLGKDFAVKFYSGVYQDEQSVGVARFLQEASILFDLHHPNIIRFHDAGVSFGIPWIKMEYFDGTAMHEAIHPGITLPARRAFELVRRLAEGLAHAHDVGVLHRDLCPRNVLIKPGDLRIIDFGLATYLDDERSRLTRTGVSIDSGAYTPPELRRVSSTEWTTAGDVYGIGAIWAYALTGRDPNGTEGLRDLTEVPGHHLALIEKCLSEPDVRFDSVEELLGAMNSSARIDLPARKTLPLDVREETEIKSRYAVRLRRAVRNGFAQDITFPLQVGFFSYILRLGAQDLEEYQDPRVDEVVPIWIPEQYTASTLHALLMLDESGESYTEPWSEIVRLFAAGAHELWTQAEVEPPPHMEIDGVWAESGQTSGRRELAEELAVGLSYGQWEIADPHLLSSGFEVEVRVRFNEPDIPF